jgi:hypothetical protein
VGLFWLCTSENDVVSEMIMICFFFSSGIFLLAMQFSFLDQKKHALVIRHVNLSFLGLFVRDYLFAAFIR